MLAVLLSEMDQVHEHEPDVVLEHWGLVLDGLPMQSPTGSMAHRRDR